nr:TNF receptor-associated factor 5-like [Dermacentor andersoni]
MSGPEQRALHRVYGSVSGVNWRPTRFVDELVLTRYACSVCAVIPSTTFVLPCCHALCGQCLAGSVAQDGGSVCPLDGELFCEDECQKCQLPERKKRNLKAHCWNERHGCDFVGPLAVLLEHFEAECGFHTSPCQRCGEDIPNAKLAAHHIGGCGAGSFSSALLAESSHRAQAKPPRKGAAGDVTATAHGIEGHTGNPYEDEIPALQSQVNELTEAARAQSAQLQDLNATLAVSLEALNAAVFAAAEKLTDAIAEASQLLEHVRASREEESSRSHEDEASASDSSDSDVFDASLSFPWGLRIERPSFP